MSTASYYLEEELLNESYANEKICKFCGASGLHWVKTKNDFRLADYNDNIHICKIRPAPEHQS